MMPDLEYPTFPDLKFKKAIITAATAGIGKATAEAFLLQGTNVALLSRSADKLATVASDLQRQAAHGAKVYTVQVDLSDLADTRLKTKQALELLGGVDIIFNNGPGMSQAAFEALLAGNTDLGQMETYKVNCVVPYVIFETCLDALKKSTAASVINMSSIGGKVVAPALLASAYNSAKLAVVAMSRDQAMLHAKDGIRVNVVSPGFTKTDIVPTAAAMFGMPAEDYNSWRDQCVPLGTCGEPSDVAATVLFLASSASRWITGQDIVMDGGTTLTCNTALAPGAVAKML